MVESKRPNPVHGGAIVLLDKELNTVSVRMYNEHVESCHHVIKVEHACEAPTNGLYARISKTVDPSKDPWKGFSKAVDDGIRIRAERLKKRVKRPI